MFNGFGFMKKEAGGPSYTVPTGMDLELLLDGDANDSSGNGYNFTNNGASFITPSGASIQAADFEATATNTGDDLDGDAYASNFEYTGGSGGEFYVSFWAAFDATQDGSTVPGVFAVTADGSGGDFSGYLLYLFNSTGYLGFRCYNSTTTFGQADSGTGLNDGTFRHIVCAKSSSGVYLYVNKTEYSDTSANAQGTIRYRASDRFQIGARHDASSGAVQGQLDGTICLFRVYPNFPSTSDIENLYDEGVDLLGL